MSAASEPQPIAALWSRVRALWERACAAIGAPQAIAGFAALAGARQHWIACHIALVETIVRKLLFAEAAALIDAERTAAARSPRVEIVPLASPQWSASFGSACATSAARRHAFDATQPESWRASFALKPPREHTACAPPIRALWGDGPAQTPPLRVARTTRPAQMRLAVRLEAVRRVLADPAPHIRRLARLLPRLCRRNTYAALRYATETARPHRSDTHDPRLMIDAMALALAAAPIVLNSS